MLHLARKLAVVSAAFAVVAGLAWADDEVQRRSGGVPLRGTITEENSREITIQRKDNGKTETVSVSDIARVKYDGKTGLDISQAEILEQGGEYQKAVDAYAKVAQEAAGKELAARAASFGRVRAIVRQAQRDARRIDDAIHALETFRTQHPNSRFHFALYEMLGQLEMSRGNSEPARAAFAELAKAPWPALKLKAALYEARMLVSAGQYDQAIIKFDEIAQSSGEGAEEKLPRYEALVGKAECWLKQKKYDDAATMLHEIVDAASSEHSALHATAYNLLGDVERETGKPKAALLSYLHVDLLFSGERDEHAKALYYIAQLQDQIGRPDRAEEARTKLKRDYPNSPWVKRTGPPTQEEKLPGAARESD